MEKNVNFNVRLEEYTIKIIKPLQCMYISNLISVLWPILYILLSQVLQLLLLLDYVNQEDNL